MKQQELYLTNDDIMMCKYVTIKRSTDDMAACTCSLSGLPCEDVLRYSDGCKYDREDPGDNPTWEELYEMVGATE